MTNAQLLITLDHVSICAGAHVLFEGLCWEILDNQHWAVVGPNGCGKSMLMRALVGLLPVSKGRILHHLMHDNGHGAVQEQIAHVTFETQRSVLGEEAFYQSRWNAGISQDAPTVSDLLSEQGINHINPFLVVESRPDDGFAARRQEVVEKLELEKLLPRNILYLSNGERRKVTIARAWLKKPRLLILDNPFSGLDERYRFKLAQNLEDLMSSEMRLMIVGTNLADIPTGITHVLLINSSRVVTQGERETILQSQAHSPEQGATLSDLKLTPSHQVTLSRRTLVEMENVTVSYNGSPVLRQINWTVRENERWALLGPNGAGKTTLLSLILGDNPQAYSNKVTLFGRPRGSGESIWEIKQNIGWVAPELQLYYPRDASCLDVICSGWFDSVGLYRQCSANQREIALALARQFDLAEQVETAFGQVSEGEQRLVLLARALAKSPALLVLDEPCQGLDPMNRERVLQAVQAITSRSETCMIYVTHRADELPASITHVLRLEDGRVVEQGTKRN